MTTPSRRIAVAPSEAPAARHHERVPSLDPYV